ncbi:TetR/AcrR family transcriptional regulator [Phycicoccus sp. CSK15P-2]|uniref:TetR/AcrR family transcriptional regulator n=1 Tax=Phycicoccus sp. CSK15P-2 TaxID=2807627 RepID=UPI00194E073D|nr:TetR/AcrR family transcriptional regulator [Phycicoccus sp. CSK15P-2]MBM6406003.1 TetR/AcrR family transcriptional regulator [Phycicoccus sp. CSK15P-2]
MPVTQELSPRERILDTTLALLARGGRSAVTTRAVSAGADVQPQTIYRQFGDMEGLLTEATDQGFRDYLASKSARPRRSDPVDDLRDGWDLHVEFGLHHPALYLLMYGEPDTPRELAAADAAAGILRSLVDAVARAGMLGVDVETAVDMIQSTGVGVVITLIGAPPAPGDTSVSDSVREAVLAAVVTPPGTADVEPGRAGDAARPAASASALRASLDPRAAGLTPGEALLLDELLARIAGSGRRDSRS